MQEIENLNGQLVCPQCLASISFDINSHKEPTPTEFNSTQESQPVAPTATEPEQVSYPKQATSAIENKKATPPAQPASQEQHVDDVMRYCKRCGAFLKEGANFCPKCGNFVKVAPPRYQPQPKAQQATTPPPYQRQQSHYYNTNTQQPMANRKPLSTRRVKPSSSDKSKFSIYSIGGCLTITIITVAIFFIAYIVMGINLE